MRRTFNFFISAVILTFFLSANVQASGDHAKSKEELYSQMELIADVISLIETDYVDTVKPKDLVYGCVSGMIGSLDSHSQFMDPDEYKEIKVETKGQFGGLGIEIAIKDGLLTVITPMDDTPAFKAGLKPNDRIVKINDQITRDISISEALKKLRGEPGTKVTLTILREDANKLLEFTIIRAIIKIQSIKDVKFVDEKIGYIRITEFQENTIKDFDSGLNKLEKEGMSSLIIDLRNNPGGLLDSAIDVASEFVPNGKLIVYTKGRAADQSAEYKSESKIQRPAYPVVILVNAGSASGSEIVAGCLQDYKRAIVVGTKTFGKGSVQSVIPLKDGSALRLTTSKYFTPSGKVIHGQGVSPDITVEELKLKEVQKKRNLRFVEVFDGVETKMKQAKKSEKDKSKIVDFQLMRAIDILKVIKLYKEGLSAK